MDTLTARSVGRIEASTDPDSKLGGAHSKPYPDKDGQQMCDGGRTTRHLVLGTDFITDIALFSMRVAAPVKLKPGHSSAAVALRTASEALAQAACQLLEIEPSETAGRISARAHPGRKERS